LEQVTAIKPVGHSVRRLPRKASESRMLQEDVAAMVNDHKMGRRDGSTLDLAHDIIVVVRERVLRELESYARENIR
jgi:hypothetical protein